MTPLVTLEQAKLHLHVDHDLDDSDIELKVAAASAAVLQYIGDKQYLFLDTGGEFLDLTDTSTSGTNSDVAAARVLHIVRQATLLLVGDFYKNREPTPADVIGTGYGYLPRAVVALLYPLRDPTIA